RWCRRRCRSLRRRPSRACPRRCSIRVRLPSACVAPLPYIAAMAVPCVLLTGFDPFGGQTLNPSWQAVQALHGRTVAGHAVVGAQLPTVFGASLQALRELLRQHRPTLVLASGQAGGRAALSLERVAINVNDARIADNAG